MPKKISNKLTVKQVEALRLKGYYADGGNLYLRVTSTGAKSWAFFYTISGKTREMGLGSYPDISLSDARARAIKQRQQIAEGYDPIEEKNAAKLAKMVEKAKAITFQQAAEQYIESHRSGWKNAKHGDQWSNTLRDYAYPVFGTLPVSTIDTNLVVKAVESIWQTKTETASRVRGRIESVLDWATTRGYRTGENPARWRGHLENLLPARNSIQKVKHHAALPIEAVSKFMSDLRNQQGNAARALELCILTATRTGEAIGARWEEIDFTTDTWTIPSERMKLKKEHAIPLPPRAREILKVQKANSDSEFVFEGGKQGKPLSNMAMLELLKRMERTDITVHGFRSTFRDWAAEHTTFPSEVCEMALAHAVGNAVERAYRRGDLFNKRTKLMQQWAQFCEQEFINPLTTRTTIVQMRKAR
jgi:integrase